jgi:hypothetical protein
MPRGLIAKSPRVFEFQRKWHRSLFIPCLRAQFEDFGQNFEFSARNSKSSLYISLFIQFSTSANRGLAEVSRV